MTQSPAAVFDLRRLCRAAQVISAVLEAPAKPHQVGLGIKRKHHYALTHDEPCRLPATLEGLSQVLSTVAQPIDVDVLPEELTASAWGALLGKPGLTAQLPPPGVDELLQSGFVVADDEAARLRQLALAVVVRPAYTAITAEGTLLGPPMAGVARLVLVTSKHRRDVSVRAWLQATWHGSTSSMSEALEELYLVAVPTGRHHGARRRVVLLTDASVTEGRDPDPALAAILGLHGFDLTVFGSADYLGKALAAVKETPPSVLLVCDHENLDRSAPVVERYRAASNRPRVYRLRSGSRDVMLAKLREHLATANGISPGLFIVAEDLADDDEVPTASATATGRLPVRRPGRKLRHDGWGWFMEDEEDGRWYSVDQAGHAGSATKRFRASAKGLIWEADLDDSSDRMMKHKSPIGRQIPWKDLHG